MSTDDKLLETLNEINENLKEIDKEGTMGKNAQNTAEICWKMSEIDEENRIEVGWQK